MKVKELNTKQSTLNTIRIFFNKKGFSLLELLVVIGIIGILVSMGIVSFSTAQKKARDAKRKTDLRAIKNAMEQYYSVCNGAYPPSPLGNNITTSASCSINGQVIMATVPRDPKTTSPYNYNAGANPPTLCVPNTGWEAETGTSLCISLEQ